MEIFDQKSLDLAYYHYKTGRNRQVQTLCENVLAHNPRNLEAIYLYMRASSLLKEHEKAIHAVDDLLRYTAEPHKYYGDYYEVATHAGCAENALHYFTTRTTYAHDDYQAWHFLGMSFFECGELEKAREALNTAIALNPSQASSYAGLGKLESKLSNFFQAEEHLRKACSLSPKSHFHWFALACVLKYSGRADEAVEYYQKTIELDAGNAIYFSIYLMNFLCTTQYSPEYIFREHQSWSNHFERPLVPTIPFTNDQNPTKRIKVGYVSSDLSKHPVAFFIEPVITHHNRQFCDIYLYANVETPDYITDQLKQRGCIWRDILPLDDDAAAALIREDGIDILVDLGGHTRSNRLLVFTRKPAPVQATWLGYAHSTGLRSIDYRITDAVSDPPGMTEQFHSEAIYRLPGSFICYRPPIDPPDIAPLPCIKNGYITFAAFNNSAKTNQQLFAHWAEILLRLPGSRLMMKDAGFAHPGMRQYVLNSFASHGIAENRIDLLGRFPYLLDHLSQFCQADISLDAYPYNGTTTTCESLWMGVPVVTLAGPSHVSRVGASILNHVGVPELIAYNRTEYRDIAVRLANDLDRLQKYRAALREMMLQSSLMDVTGFTGKLEDAYRVMWQRWCTGNQSQQS